MKSIRIFCKNTNAYHDVPKGATLEDVYELLNLQIPHCVTSCKVNNRVEGLHYTLNDSRDIEYLNLTSPSGLRTYTRSLFFVLYKAVYDLYPGGEVRIGTPVSNGYYCRLDIEGGVTPEVVDRLREQMLNIVRADLPFRRVTAHTTEAIELFRSQGLTQKVKLLESIGDLYTHYYILDGTVNYFYGSLLLRTSQLRLFDVMSFGEGILLRVPDSENPDRLRPMKEQRKIFSIFQEQHRWQDILGCTTVGELNQAIKAGYTNDLVNVAEALQEKKIAQIATYIAEHEQLKVVLIAGPSSSGKTTFAKRLSVQLMASGKKPVSISMDNYFVDRELTPLDQKGDYDFEHIEAVNLPLFNDQMCRLLNGEEVELPVFDFPTGKSRPSGKNLRLKPDTILILEGNHALNPRMSECIPAENKYKIYASALTTIMLDDHNYIPTTDSRLLRRICRDYKYRGYHPQEVIRRCASVTAGEEKWIFPFQEQADVMINTALIYELAALRAQALPLLEMVPECAAEYSEAYRLRKFITYFTPMPIEAVPPTSLLREFMGHSVFKH
ncbi:nucleoside kinase [Alloprevotella sp. OH1205_COT-284]|uniref:nucleoside kinase n=1 Tax=Alloprevotella sp. OH1205_COT-284 TaxID=2491043 RepID=UPI000F6035E7|nr:nucleoside kinase [Alloprevotella sp. OH1205_COT-284]RRD80815.1 nucleoside kinase [Alloprevotella sp. OH1205_COT-284]